MSMKTAVLALLGIFASSVTWADRMGPSGDKFYEEAAHYENACRNDACQAPYSEQVVYNQKTKINLLSRETAAVLKKIASHQAQVWADTILEGDYYASGVTRLDNVLAFYKDGQLVGYKIQYSEKAWNTSECDFDGSKNSLKNCQPGRISEGSYVSSDAQTYFSDEERYAEFSFTKN